jgi:lipocalin
MRIATNPLVLFLIVVLQSTGIIIVQCYDSESLRGRNDRLDDDSSSSTITVFHTNVTRANSLQSQSLQSQRDLFLFGSNNCPPSGFDAKQDFDIDLYLGRWYAQKQIPVAYQSIDEFYCVTADYTMDKNFCIFCNYAARIDILNQARKGSVDGEKLGGANRFFRGIIRRPRTDPAKITVGFLAPFLIRASYWVVAAGSYADILLGAQTINPTSDYEWAIITGGPPSRDGANGTCKPNPGVLNFLGMWMFARDSVPPEGVIAAIEAYALNTLNLDTSAWFPVQHEGCVYD